MAGPSLMATLGANIAPFLSNLEQAKSQAREGGESIASALGGELSSKLAAFGSVVGLEEYIRRTVEWASSMGDLSIRTGLAVTELQAMQNIAAISGSSVEALASLYERLGKAMANPDNRAVLERHTSRTSGPSRRRSRPTWRRCTRTRGRLFRRSKR